MNIAWHRLIALVLFVVGVWVELIFGLLFGVFESSERAPIENAAGGVFIVLGLVLMGLSYFIARRRNWARVIIVLCLLVTCVAMVVLLVKRVITGSIRSRDEVGEFLVGIGLLIFPAAATVFLVNKPVVDEFQKSNGGDA